MCERKVRVERERERYLGFVVVGFLLISGGLSHGRGARGECERSFGRVRERESVWVFELGSSGRERERESDILGSVYKGLSFGRFSF